RRTRRCLLRRSFPATPGGGGSAKKVTNSTAPYLTGLRLEGAALVHRSYGPERAQSNRFTSTMTDLGLVKIGGELNDSKDTQGRSLQSMLWIQFTIASIERRELLLTRKLPQLPTYSETGSKQSKTYGSL